MNVFITGTSSGLGFGLANLYLSEGHKVYGVSRKLNNDLQENPNFELLIQDISKFGVLENNISSFLKDIRKLDLVILNAGILNDIKDLKDTDLDEIKKVMDVNVWSNKLIIDTLFQKVETLSQVVAISSGASVSGSRGWNAYSLSKAALNMLINLYAKEHEQTHFCALAPGLIHTKMQDYVSTVKDDDKFPTIKKLKEARGTADMPNPTEAAKIVSDGIVKALNYQSGNFLDVRKM